MPVIYLTGAPVSGKSTLARNLKKSFPGLLVFAYSEQLRDQIASRSAEEGFSEDDIRRLSSIIVTPQDIEQLDRKLIELVRANRGSRSILIDSHAATKEDYGFRVTGFSTDQLLALNPDVIICLYTSDDVTIERIRQNPMGRPEVSLFEASMHTQMQAAVAIQYGVVLGKPVYFFDSACDQENLVNVVASKSKL